MLRKNLITLIIFILLFGAGLISANWCVNKLLQQPVILQDNYIVVHKGISITGMLRILEQQQAIRHSKIISKYFQLRSRILGQDIIIQSGKYQLQPNMLLNDVIDLWVKGQVLEHKITLVEGWNLQQIRAALAKNQDLVHKLPKIKDDDLMAILGKDGHYEGRFFPATYSFRYEDEDISILKRASDKLDSELEKHWQNRAANLPYQNKYEALIMASIIEKETSVISEYEEIAGVFVRRLQKGMRLQTDPTVIYGMGESYTGKISYRNLRKESPYNTYLIKGLPPTPIAAAGSRAIYAALHPKAGTSLYFVARGDGTHEFSATLADHNKAVGKYQLKRAQNYRSTPAKNLTDEISNPAAN